MKIKALAPWFGSKRTLAPVISHELGNHAAYFEPFCGSMAVLLAKPPASHETVNDLHKDLVNLARVLADERTAAELYGTLSRLLYTHWHVEAAAKYLAATPLERMPDVERAVRYFVASWMGRNGSAGCPMGTPSLAVRWTPSGGSGPTRFRNAVDSIPSWHMRLRNVCILNLDAFDVIARIHDHPRTAIYVDPPYFLDTRGTGGGSRYLHDFEDADHKRLAEALRRFTQARVVISYYDHPTLPELYPGWTIRAVHRAKHLANTQGRGSQATVAPEVLLINGPSYSMEADQ